MQRSVKKRPSEINQQHSRAVRPPLPRDASKGGENCFTPGKMPNGYTAVWEFGTGKQTKLSPTRVKK